MSFTKPLTAGWIACAALATCSAGATRAVAGDADMKLPGGKSGAAFESMTIEGENRIRIEFARPELELQLDARSALQLDFGNPKQIVDRVPMDHESPFLSLTSAGNPSPYLGRPWLDNFQSGSVVRFQPAVEDVAGWKLLIADSRGQTVAMFEGKDKPAAEIEWDGRTLDGLPAMPGLTYSYVFEAVDRAGNRRNFVGEGFGLPAYRYADDQQQVMLLTGGDLADGEDRLPPALLLEAASWLNQHSQDRPVEVRVVSRNYDAGSALAALVTRHLRQLMLGDTARIQNRVEVLDDAPASGAIAIATGSAAAGG